MNLKTKDGIQQAYDNSILNDKGRKENLKYETRMIMYRFLSEIERLSDERAITRKQLAKLIGTSPSYITQLFKGKKIINLETIAKMQEVFDVAFRIQACTKLELTNSSYEVMPGKKTNQISVNVFLSTGSSQFIGILADSQLSSISSTETVQVIATAKTTLN